MASNQGQLPCGKCGHPVDVEMGVPSIVNREGVSIIIIEHSVSVPCPGCLTRVLPVVVNVGGIAVQLAPVAVPQAGNLIIPGNDTTN